jgi:hypothetical protein
MQCGMGGTPDAFARRFLLKTTCQAFISGVERE